MLKKFQPKNQKIRKKFLKNFYRRSDQLTTIDVISIEKINLNLKLLIFGPLLDEVPDHDAEGDDEEDGADHGVDALHAVDGGIEKVQDWKIRGRSGDEKIGEIFALIALKIREI